MVFMHMVFSIMLWPLHHLFLLLCLFSWFILPRSTALLSNISMLLLSSYFDSSGCGFILLFFGRVFVWWVYCLRRKSRERTLNKRPLPEGDTVSPTKGVKRNISILSYHLLSFLKTSHLLSSLSFHISHLLSFLIISHLSPLFLISHILSTLIL